MDDLYWVLEDDHSVRPARDREEGMAMWESDDKERRTVARTELPDGVTVSTVFLVIDHAFGGGPPLLFETMVFGLPDGSESQWRYRTWDEALVGHIRITSALELGLDPDTLEIP